MTLAVTYGAHERAHGDNDDDDDVFDDDNDKEEVRRIDDTQRVTYGAGRLV